MLLEFAGHELDESASVAAAGLCDQAIVNCYKLKSTVKHAPSLKRREECDELWTRFTGEDMPGGSGSDSDDVYEYDGELREDEASEKEDVSTIAQEGPTILDGKVSLQLE